MSGFQAYRIEGSESTRVPIPEQVAAEKDDSFVLPEHFWQWFESDEVVRVEMHRRIEEKAKIAAEERFVQLRAAVEQKAFEEGVQRGIEEARLRVAEVVGQLEEICSQVIADKQKLLHEHEAEWGHALGHILERFLIPKPELTIEQITKWANDGLMSFEKAGRIRIRLSAEDFKRVNEGHSKAGTRWELVEDPVLSKGQIQCDCDSGGFFFSPTEQWEKLNQWIDRFTGRK